MYMPYGVVPSHKPSTHLTPYVVVTMVLTTLPTFYFTSVTVTTDHLSLLICHIAACLMETGWRQLADTPNLVSRPGHIPVRAALWKEEGTGKCLVV